MPAKADPARDAPGEVDAYLAELPADARACLSQVREVVKGIAPRSSERVSYGVPIFRLTTDLVGMSARGSRCSLHVMSTRLVQDMAEELHGIGVSGATIHFSPGKPLPTDLIATIVRRRMEEMASG